MSESGRGDDVAATMDKNADEMEHHLHELEDHIADAQKAAEVRREDLDPEIVEGDWDDTKGTAGQGDDPKGAVDVGDDEKPAPSPTPGDADGGDD